MSHDAGLPLPGAHALCPLPFLVVVENRSLTVTDPIISDLQAQAPTVGYASYSYGDVLGLLGLLGMLGRARLCPCLFLLLC